MKKVLMALTMIAIAHYSAEAQNENYKVCKYTTGYATCGHEKTATNEYQNQPKADWVKAVDRKTGKAQNFKVCKYASGYATCGREKPAVETHSSYMPMPVDTWPAAPVAPAPQPKQAVLAPHVSYTYYDRMVSIYNRPKHHVIKYSDDMNAPYKGENSLQNDGVAKNDYRNLNYQLATADLPPSSGSFTK